MGGSDLPKFLSHHHTVTPLNAAYLPNDFTDRQCIFKGNYFRCGPRWQWQGGASMLVKPTEEINATQQKFNTMKSERQNLCMSIRANASLSYHPSAALNEINGGSRFLGVGVKRLLVFARWMMMSPGQSGSSVHHSRFLPLKVWLGQSDTFYAGCFLFVWFFFKDFFS